MARSDKVTSENDAPAAVEGTLVARAATTTVMAPRDALADANASVHRDVDDEKAFVETLAASFDALRIVKNTAPLSNATTRSTTTTMRRNDAAISPADFVNLQSMRSSALARKTNTTSKFSRDCRNLFSDLLAPTAAAEEKKPEELSTKCTVKTEKQRVVDIKKTIDEAGPSQVTALPNSDKTSKLKVNGDKVKSTEEADVDTKTPLTNKKKEDEQESTLKGDERQTKEQKVEGDDDEEKEKLLLSRGPVRASRPINAYHPYGGQTGNVETAQASGSGVIYGTAAQSTVYDSTSFSSNVYSYGYDCGATQYGSGANAYQAGVCQSSFGINSALDSRESTPDTVHSDLSYGNICSPLVGIPSHASNGIASNCNAGDNVASIQAASSYYPSSYANTQSHELNHVATVTKSKPKSETEEQELPDALSDFILQYSRRYASDNNKHMTSGSQGSSPAQSSAAVSSTLTSAESSPLAYYGNDFDLFSAPNSNKSTMPADASEIQCASPLSAISAPKCSPAQPHGTRAIGAGGEQPALAPQRTSAISIARPAKERLRALINNDDMDEAWAWTCKCIQNYPGALCYQDADRDTLLHIVALHADHAKIYALVEQMLKMESEYSGSEIAALRRQNPFDMPNRTGETPLFLAVEKRDVAVVDYLLEAGAQPNAQNFCIELNTPLHYASSRGMTQIVEILCAHPRIDVNLANGVGATPLLYAVKHHGALDDDISGGRPIDNLSVVRALLRHGADANYADSTNGKTVFHLAVERLSEELIMIFHAHLGDEAAARLVNRADHSGETPLRLLQKEEAVGATRGNDDEMATRSRLCLALISCGADGAE